MFSPLSDRISNFSFLAQPQIFFFSLNIEVDRLTMTSSNNFVHVNGSQSVRCLRPAAFRIKLLNRSFATHFISGEKWKKKKLCQTSNERKDEKNERINGNEKRLNIVIWFLSRDGFLSMRQVERRRVCCQSRTHCGTMAHRNAAFISMENHNFTSYFSKCFCYSYFIFECCPMNGEWVLNVIAENGGERERGGARALMHINISNTK